MPSTLNSRHQVSTLRVLVFGSESPALTCQMPADNTALPTIHCPIAQLDSRALQRPSHLVNAAALLPRRMLDRATRPASQIRSFVPQSSFQSPSALQHLTVRNNYEPLERPEHRARCHAQLPGPLWVRSRRSPSLHRRHNNLRRQGLRVAVTVALLGARTDSPPTHCRHHDHRRHRRLSLALSPSPSPFESGSDLWVGGAGGQERMTSDSDKTFFWLLVAMAEPLERPHVT